MRNKMIIDNGKTLRQLSDEHGILTNTLRLRYANGLRGADLVKPVGKRRTSAGETFKELSARTGVKVSTINDRYRKYKTTNPAILGAKTVARKARG